MAGKRSPKNITQTAAWRGAEYAYAEVLVAGRMPLFGEPMSVEQVDQRMAAILETCPRFYPALVQRGVYQLSTGGEKQAEEFLDRGFEQIVELLAGEELVDAVDELIDGLEQLLRYDLCCRYLEKLVEMYPQQALYYDYWAGNELKRRNGSAELAGKLQTKALELDPDNPTFLSNLGWIHLTAGELEAAEGALRTALSIKPKHEAARANMGVLRRLKRRTGGGTFRDFLLRPVNYARIGKLEEAEDWDKLDRIIADYNQSRLEAFEEFLLAEGEYRLHQIWNFKTTLRLFFSFIDQMVQDRFLFDDLWTVDASFKQIMHAFIVKHGDVDEEIINDIYASLAVFYSFLARRKLAAADRYRDLLRNMETMKTELLEKMHRYNQIRHEDSVSEEEKEEIRSELFVGDHWILL